MKKFLSLFISLVISMQLANSSPTGYENYIIHIQDQIRSNWDRKITPLTYPYSLKTILEFYVLRDGSIANIHTSKKSGIYEFDKLAIHSLIESAPFLPLDRDIKIIFDFEYKRQEKSFFNKKKIVPEYKYDKSTPYSLEKIEKLVPIVKTNMKQVQSELSLSPQLESLTNEDYKILAKTKLQLPLDCKIGQNCFIGLYPAHKDGNDFACGRMAQANSRDTIFFTYGDQGHKNVLAILDGTVSSSFANNNISTGCGNEVVIDHNNNLQSTYCQLSTIKVRAGQKVKAGDLIGSTGQTGGIDYESLQFGLEYKGINIDPFTANSLETNCSNTGAISTKSMWQNHIFYKSTGLLRSGVSDSTLPEIKEAMLGKFSETSIRNDANSLITWVLGFGLLKGDLEEFTIYGPDSNIFLNTSSICKESQRTFIRYFGLTNKEEKLQKGNYRMNYKLSRDNKTIIDTDFAFEVVQAPTLE